MNDCCKKTENLRAWQQRWDENEDDGSLFVVEM
jgi:hypothetical protein